MDPLGRHRLGRVGQGIHRIEGRAQSRLDRGEQRYLGQRGVEARVHGRRPFPKLIARHPVSAERNG